MSSSLFYRNRSQLCLRSEMRHSGMPPRIFECVRLQQLQLALLKESLTPFWLKQAFFMHRENLSASANTGEHKICAIMNAFWENHRQVKVQLFKGELCCKLMNNGKQKVQNPPVFLYLWRWKTNIKQKYFHVLFSWELVTYSNPVRWRSTASFGKCSTPWRAHFATWFPLSPLAFLYQSFVFN